jgi:hypothetical protein
MHICLEEPTGTERSTPGPGSSFLFPLDSIVATHEVVLVVVEDAADAVWPREKGRSHSLVFLKRTQFVPFFYFNHEKTYVPTYNHEFRTWFILTCGNHINLIISTKNKDIAKLS